VPPRRCRAQNKENVVSIKKEIVEAHEPGFFTAVDGTEIKPWCDEDNEQLTYSGEDMESVFRIVKSLIVEQRTTPVVSASGGTLFYWSEIKKMAEQLGYSSGDVCLLHEVFYHHAAPHFF
jgi:hypothetical protein